MPKQLETPRQVTRQYLLKCDHLLLPDEVVKALDEAWMVAKPTTANYWHGEIDYKYDTREALGLNN